MKTPTLLVPMPLALFISMSVLAVPALGQMRLGWTSAIRSVLPALMFGRLRPVSERLLGLQGSAAYQSQVFAPLVERLENLSRTLPDFQALSADDKKREIFLALSEAVESTQARAAEILEEGGALKQSRERLEDNVKDAEELLLHRHAYLTPEAVQGLIAVRPALDRRLLEARARTAIRKAAAEARRLAANVPEETELEAGAVKNAEEGEERDLDLEVRRGYYALIETPLTQVSIEAKNYLMRDVRLAQTERTAALNDWMEADKLLHEALYGVRGEHPRVGKKLFDRLKPLLDRYTAHLDGDKNLGRRARHDKTVRVKDLFKVLKDLFDLSY